MIKQLNQIEIDEIGRKIESFRSDDYYKYYFDDSEENNPDKAFFIDDKYYIDFTFYDDICFMGVIDINREIKTTSNSVYELLKLFDEQLKYYQKIAQWCYKANKIAYRFHKFLKKKYNCVSFEDKEKSIIGVMLL
ncbi:hypothetical protein [Fusobacterium nucleatum]|uniref:hypothetical protein n=1 Tax=Fusobacterium nucleatum TaxID=851 RepID=UPI0030CB412E